MAYKETSVLSHEKRTKTVLPKNHERGLHKRQRHVKVLPRHLQVLLSLRVGEESQKAQNARDRRAWCIGMAWQLLNMAAYHSRFEDMQAEAREEVEKGRGGMCRRT